MNKLSLIINNQNFDVPSQLPQLTKGTSVNEILSFTVDILLIVAVIASLSHLVWGGLDFITSGGDKTKKNSAKNKVTFSIVGLIVSLLAAFFVYGIQSIMGFRFF